jgi:hypothetical protein
MVHRSVSTGRFMIHAEAVSRAIDHCETVHIGDVVAVDEDEAVGGLDD